MLEVNESTENESTQTQDPQEPVETPSGDEAPSQSAQDILDLEKVQKFKFGGQEWTPKDFQSAYMRQADYTRKSQALAQERRFIDNLNNDLQSVKSNPSLVEEFKRIYPEKYHSYLGYVLNQTSAQPGSVSAGQTQAQGNGQNQTPQGVDPNFYAEFQEWKQEMRAQQVRAHQAELESTFSTLKPKYPMADEEAVLARAQVLDAKGDKLTPQVFENLFKAVHEKNLKLWNQVQSEKVNKQKELNSRAKDAPSGGGTPGVAPKQPRTIKEASRFALEELEQN